mmetsp:Transcript_74940/g.139849  ORF Transcript_74940/g.139849 Transcript_74940/m.139849 type:complete len:217 (-) Transcript_74940:168-818(-)
MLGGKRALMQASCSTAAPSSQVAFVAAGHDDGSTPEIQAADVDRPAVVQEATDGVCRTLGAGMTSQLEEAWARSMSAMQRAATQHVNQVAQLQAQIQARIEASWRLHAENQKLCKRMQALQYHLNVCLAAPDLVPMPTLAAARLALLEHIAAEQGEEPPSAAPSSDHVAKIPRDSVRAHGDTYRTPALARMAGRARASEAPRLHPVLESDSDEEGA